MIGNNVLQLFVLLGIRFMSVSAIQCGAVISDYGKYSS